MKKNRILLLFSLMVMLFFMASCDMTKVYSITLDYDDTKGTVVVTEPNDTTGTKYTAETEVTLAVSAKNNYVVNGVFINGTGVVLVKDESAPTKAGSYTFIIKSDTTIKVEFAEAEKFSVSVTETEHIKTSLSGSSSSVGYFAGDVVTVTFNVSEGYELKDVKVNGKAVEVTDNTYTFTITENVSIEYQEAVKKIEFNEEMLESLKGNVTFDGSYVIEYPESSESYTNFITTKFTENAVYQLEIDASTNEVTYDATFYNKDGYATTSMINIMNEVIENVSEDLFSDFTNPFDGLTVADFVWVENGLYALNLDADALSDAAARITGWSESIKTFHVVVEGNKVVKVRIITDDMEDPWYGDLYYSSYDIDVVDKGTTEIEVITEGYEVTADHQVLADALSAVPTNYKVKYTDIWEGEEDVVYNVYVDEYATYSDYVATEGAVTYGYTAVDDVVYEFEYDGSKVTYTNIIPGATTIADVQADFTAFAAALFDYVGDGRYVLKSSIAAAYVVPYVGVDYDTIRLGEYATSLEIVVKDGVLFSVIFDYEVYGYAGKAVLEYSDFGTTVVPVDFSGAEFVDVLAPYVGEFVSADGNYVVTIDSETGIFVNDTEFVVESYGEIEAGIYVLVGFTGTVDGKEAYLVERVGKSSLELIILGETEADDIDVILAKQITTPVIVDLPEEIKGVWENELHSIKVQSHAVFVDGVEYTVLAYEEEMVSLSYQGASYVMFVTTDDETAETVLWFSDLEAVNVWYLSKTVKSAGIEIPVEYVGTYMSADTTVTVVITVGTITVNGELFTITSYDDYYGFSGVLGDSTEEYFVAPGYSADQLQVGTMSSNHFVNKVNPDEVVIEFSDSELGTFKGTDLDTSVEYTVVVEKTQVTINGTVYTPTAYNEAYATYEVSNDGSAFYLMYYNGELILSDSSADLLVECVRQNEGQDEVVIPAEFVGTYKGNDKNGDPHTVVITETTITVDSVVAVIVSYDDYEGFTVTVDGVEYYIMDSDYEAGITGICLMKADYSYFTLDKEVATISFPERFYGTYEGAKDETTSYVVVISETGTTVNGVEFILTEITEYDDYVGTVDGVEYTIWESSYTEEVTKIAIMVGSEFSTVCELTKEVLPSVTIGTKFHGTYVGTDSNSQIEYTVVITSTLVTVNDEPYTPSVYDDYEGVTFLIGEIEYYIFQHGYAAEVTKICIADETNSVYAVLEKQSGSVDPDPITIPTSYHGEFTNADGDTLVVTSTSFTLNDIEGFAYVDMGAWGLTVKWNGYEGSLFESMDVEGALELSFEDGDGYLTYGPLSPKGAADPDPITIPADYHGEFTNTAGDTLVVTSTSFTLNDVEGFAYVDMGSWGISVKWNNLEGTLYQSFTVEGGLEISFEDAEGNYIEYATFSPKASADPDPIATPEVKESVFTDKTLTVGDGQVTYTTTSSANSFDSSQTARGVQFLQTNGVVVIKSETVENVTKVVLTLASNSETGMKVSVKVGDTVFKCGDATEYSFPKSGNAEVVFTSDTEVSGVVTITLTPSGTAKSMYISKVALTVNKYE